jgi:hypothetical protein
MLSISDEENKNFVSVTLGSRCLCWKVFFSLSLTLLVKLTWVPNKAFCLVTVASKASSLPYRSALERCSTREGSVLIPKYWTRLERLGRDKHCSLFSLSNNDEGKKSFYNLSFKSKSWKTFFFLVSDDSEKERFLSNHFQPSIIFLTKP